MAKVKKTIPKKSGKLKKAARPGHAKMPKRAVKSGGKKEAEILRIIAKIQTPDAWKKYPDKHKLLHDFFSYIGSVAAETRQDKKPVFVSRDQMFDFVFSHIDAMATHKKFISAVLADPAYVPQFSVAIFRIMPVWTGEWKIKNAPVPGFVISTVSSIIYGYALWRWRSDPSADGAQTMAGLDRLLQQIEIVLARAVR